VYICAAFMVLDTLNKFLLNEINVKQLCLSEETRKISKRETLLPQEN
jgi:hypothetical protein